MSKFTTKELLTELKKHDDGTSILVKQYIDVLDCKNRLPSAKGQLTLAQKKHARCIREFEHLKRTESKFGEGLHKIKWAEFSVASAGLNLENRKHEYEELFESVQKYNEEGLIASAETYAKKLFFDCEMEVKNG